MAQFSQRLPTGPQLLEWLAQELEAQHIRLEVHDFSIGVEIGFPLSITAILSVAALPDQELTMPEWMK